MNFRWLYLLCTCFQSDRNRGKYDTSDSIRIERGRECNILVNLLLAGTDEREDSTGSPSSKYSMNRPSRLPLHLLIYHVISFLNPEEGLLILRSLNNTFNYQIVKLYKRILRDEFPEQIKQLPVFRGWTMACVKFLNGVLPAIMDYKAEFEGKEHDRVVTRRMSSLSPRSVKKVYCDDTVVDFMEPDASLPMQKMTFPQLTSMFVRRYREKGDQRSLCLFLDFLNYCGVVLRREDVPELIVLLKELKTLSKHGNITAGKSERKLVYSGLAFAYKIVKVLGHPSFYDETIGRPSTPNEQLTDQQTDRKRSKDLVLRVYRLSESAHGHGEDGRLVLKSWGSAFDDERDICRSSIRSFDHI